ncbi:MAG: GNAT family N-acetyltransferase [Pirellulaceae bacterium]
MPAFVPLVLTRIPVACQTAALQLAARAWPADERTGQLAAIEKLVAEGRAEDILLIEARRGAELVGAVLAQTLCGRSAVVWPPQSIDADDSTTAASLLQSLHDRLTASGTHLAQTILDSANEFPAATMVAAGYVYAGELCYMAALAECFPEREPPRDWTVEPLSTANRAPFIALIDATYQGSLDCPLVDGLRDTADVLEGYRSVGQYRPEYWLTVKHEKSDIGCLILADHPAQDQMEIVYVGVVNAARGRRLGLALTRHAQWLARQEGKARLVLAVDQANRPAILAYQSAGFVAWDRRSLFVRAFLQAPSSFVVMG